MAFFGDRRVGGQAYSAETRIGDLGAADALVGEKLEELQANLDEYPTMF